LRETLRNTVLQLRDAQNQLAALQTAQAECDQNNKALTEQITLLKKHSGDDKAAADKAIAGLEAKVADQNTEIAQFKESLEKWKVAYGQAADVARAEQTQRTKLADDNLVFERRVAYLETKNVALFNLGNEILTRYEQFSLGNALAAKEPFVGVTRTKLENLVQDYQDKLLDQKARP
jgi:chromosome segregation ATPase